MQARNIVLCIAYDGSQYLGWQKTKEGPSIEGALQLALETILQHTISLQAASRTDRGVHATGQVVNFFTPNTINTANLQKRLNQLLPDDIVVRDIYHAADDFHPTLHATKKEYHYHIASGLLMLPHLRHTHWHVPSVALDTMERACSAFVGTHDFKAFCNHRKDLCYESTIRTLFAVKLEEQPHSTCRITLFGDHFLYKMARNIVGTLVDIGKGNITIDEIKSIFASSSRPCAGVTAPAHGLVLHKVFY